MCRTPSKPVWGPGLKYLSPWGIHVSFNTDVVIVWFQKRFSSIWSWVIQSLKRNITTTHHYNKAIWYTSKSIHLLPMKTWRKGIKEHKNRIPHSLFLKSPIHGCIWNTLSSSQTAESTAPFLVWYIYFIKVFSMNSKDENTSTDLKQIYITPVL